MTQTEANCVVPTVILLMCKKGTRENCGIYTRMRLVEFGQRDRLMYGTINNIRIVCIENVMIVIFQLANLVATDALSHSGSYALLNVLCIFIKQSVAYKSYSLFFSHFILVESLP